MTASVLYDQLGPLGRRRVAVGSAAAYVGLAGILAIAAKRLHAKGQFEGRRWDNLTNPELLRFLGGGLWSNVKAALLGAALAAVLGGVLALLRLSRAPLPRLLAGGFVEIFRAVPLLLLILGTAIVLPRYTPYDGLPPLTYVVAGLTLYHGAVLAEVFRAGILSLDRGQSEAGYAVGLSYGQVMRLVVVPQALRRMLPSVVSQVVTLFKDTSLGYVVAYEEMTRRARFATGEFSESLLQIYLLVALTFIVICFALSRFAHWLEGRQRRRYGGTVAVTGVEDLAVLQAAAPATPPKDS